MRGLRARLGRAGGHGRVLSETTHPEFARRLGLADRVMQHRATNGAPSQTARSAMFQELESGRFSQGFELLDRTRRSSNLCIEFPFFDRRLMEFCLALPASQRLRDGWTRFVQRRAMRGIVPEPVLRRAWKTNLGPSFLHGLLQFERGTLEELAHGKGERIDEFVDRPALRRLYARFLTEHSPADAFELVKVLGLAQWLRCSPDVQRQSSMSDIESKP
ncbi:MAG: asparagine synthase-related protein, partial [Planctomycetota bacterium]